VLWVLFEDLKTDLRREVRRVASFLEMEADDELLDCVCRVSSFESMSARENAHHYDEHFTKSFVGPRMGIKPDTQQDVTKVRSDGGKVGSSKAISRGLINHLNAKWAAVLAKPTGCASYEQLCEKVRELNDRCSK
jgi:hypothetical protein